MTKPRPVLVVSRHFGFLAIISEYTSRTVFLLACSVDVFSSLGRLSSWSGPLLGSVISQSFVTGGVISLDAFAFRFFSSEVGIAMLLAYVALPVRIVSAFRRQPVRLTILLRQVYDKRLSTHAITFVGCELRAAFSAALALGSSFSLERAGLLIALQ